jgi:RNase adaptor protein for sRNA GlmZ degradation
MQVTLYKASEDLRELLDQIDPDTGELPEGFQQARAIVATKSQAVAAFVLENDAQADMVETHAKKLLAKVATARRRSEWLRSYLQAHMSACGMREIKADDSTFLAKLEIERDASVEVFDERMVPSDYWRETVKRAPDKVLIGKAINDGYDVPGARIVKRDRLTIK